MSLDATHRDPSVDPGTDFYRFANGGWLDANPIPPGYGSWGSIEEVTVRNEEVLRRILESAAEAPESDVDRMLGDHFAAGLDLEAIEAAGLSAIQPLLDHVAAVGGTDDVVALLPSLHRVGVFPCFGWGVTVDHDDASKYLLWLAQAGLGLPDRDAYFDDSEAGVALREAYEVHVANQLRNLGTAADDAARLAAGVLVLETGIAELHLRGEEKRDRGRTFNRYDLDGLRALAPQLDVPRYLLELGAGEPESVNVQNPRSLQDLHAVLSLAAVDVLRAYLAFHVVAAAADALPSVFDEEDFSFYGRRIRGQQQQHERTKRVIMAVGTDMGEALGQRFVEETFPPAARERALAMVAAILDEMRRSLLTRTWMSDETRARGLEKLASVGVKIGYPDRWRDWSGLEVGRTTYAQNRLNAAAFELGRQLRQLGTPVDTTEWEMPPQVVNAYYHPTRNEIVFPAGILQPPLFDAEADDALNFGGIGTVIAHEITHGFDDQGRRFGADGAFRDWWTPDDEARFTALADRLVAQFDGYTVLDGVPINGRLTLGENIADLGGVALAYRAHARVSAGAGPVDGLTPAQRFFLANATVWRANISDELQRTLAQIDTHSPRHLRVLGPLSNLDEFQDAFDLPDDAPMLRPREERVEIW